MIPAWGQGRVQPACRGVGRALTYLGEATAAAHDLPEARRIFHDALRLAMELQATPLALDALMGLAHVHAEAGGPEQAMELSMRVLEHPAGTQDCKDRAGRLRARLETRLAAQQIQAALSRAQAKALDARAAEVLAAPGSPLGEDDSHPQSVRDSP